MITGFALAFLAGVLSVLSPCVLPLVPIVLGTALTEHRFGPIALAAGLALSFVTIGLFVATVGFSIGLDGSVFRTAAAVVLLIIGIVLIVPPLQARLVLAANPAGAGPMPASADSRRPGSGGSSVSAFSWAWSGVHASDRR